MFPHGFDPRAIRLALAVASLTGVLALGVWLVAVWRRALDDRVPSDAELLEQFRDARDDGEMDDEEFRRVQRVLAVKGEPPPAPRHLRETHAPGASAGNSPPREVQADEPPR